MKNIKKQNFLIEEIWLLTFGGAFQHSGIYKANTKEKERTYFRNMLKGYIEQIVLKKYKQPLVNWTQLDTIDMYMQIINDARVLAKQNNLSLAQWELENFVRR